MNSGVTAALLAYGLWGLMPLYFRLMAPATAIEVVAHRIVWSLALLLLWLGVLGQLGPLWRRLDARLLARLALAALLVSINWLTYVWAVTHGRTLDASLGYFLLPLFNVALGVLLLGERLTRGEWIGVMLAALGVGYLALVSPRLPWVALVLAASFGVYGLVKKQTELPAAEGMALETGLIALPALLHEAPALDLKGLTSLWWMRDRPESEAMAHLGRSSVGARLGLEQLGRSVGWYGWAQHQRHRHRAVDPLFLQRRLDRVTELTLGVRLALPGDWSLRPQVSWIHARSNVELYHYRRTLVQVTARREF